ncbi:hypothetical protein FB45DRAFT_299021 [Roridomyces roridus]|uniref:Uncharacterized protein n=1 Tax=Roridomyces roridus TaxID=1738132 RepID=A0AAD7FYZ0_9AGAR|nr:hypothetical protein FB45DRAFT_299021 [Roridomyces roridus]
MGFFGRKKSIPTVTEPNSADPRPAYLSRLSTTSERPTLTLMTASASSPTDGGLRPPPHPGLYNHSTRSLPPPRLSPSSTTLGSPLAPSVSPTSTRTVSKESRKAGGRRFAFWGRGGAKDAPPPVQTPTEAGPGGGEDGDFNLRAFRHVAPSSSPSPRGSPRGSPSPAPPSLSYQQNQHQNTSKTRLTASALSALGGDEMRPPQRPRAPSDVSASSSRISVAAFREIQARRSAAGSPALGGPAVDRERNANVVRTTGTGPRSESGHGVYPAMHAQGVRTNHPPASASNPYLPTSAPASAPKLSPKANPRRQTDDDESEDSEEEESESDSDNAPLAMLARRPGAGSAAGSSGSLPLPAQRGSPATSPSPSTTTPPLANHIPHQHSHLAQQTNPPVRSASPTSMSSSSSRPSNLRPKPKPLIDIAALTASRPQATSHQREAGFTGGGMLGSFGATSKSGSYAKMDSPKDAESPILTSRSPPVTLSKIGTPGVGGKGLVHFPTPPGSPVAEVPPPLVKEKKMEGRTVPVRSNSTGLVEMEKERARAPSPGPSRDLLSERLRAVTGKGMVPPSKDASPQKNMPPPPAFTTLAQRKVLHRRSSSDIVSGSKGWSSPAAAPPAAAEEFDLTDLADLLGGGLALVSRAGELSPPRVASGEDVTKATAEKLKQERKDSTSSNDDTIVPVVIRQRAPAAGFSVTSRPAQHDRQQSTTMVPAGSTAAEKAAASFKATNRSFSANVAAASSPASTNAPPTLRAPPSQARPAKPPPAADAARSSSYGDLGVGPRPRSSTLIPNPTPPTSLSSRSDAHTATSSSSNNSSTPSSSTSSSAGVPATVRARPRSSTMMTLTTGPPALASAASPSSRLAAPLAQPPPRPFMAAHKSPASSTAGDSSSSPAPLTPRDDSSDMSRDSGPKEKHERRAVWSGGVSGLVPSARQAHQRRSVSFDFDEEVSSDAKGKVKARPRETPVQEEERRRERRRSEAKAAIELGNVINGSGPIAEDDDDDDDVPVGHRAMPGMPMGNMPMGMNMPMPMGFAPPGGMSPGWPGMLNPAQFMIPPPADPNYYAAHQQAMMMAKQAYQMAVAQQALALAADEWERGSTMGFGDRSSVFGGSTTGPAMMSPYGMGMGMQGGWTPGGMSLFPPAPMSMYGGGGARSEYGGGGGAARSEYGGGGGNGGGWNSSRSVYGENFGPSPRSANSGATPSPSQMRNTRGDSGYFAGAQVPQSSNRTGATPRQRTASQPATPSRGAAARRQPPTSYKQAP